MWKSRELNKAEASQPAWLPHFKQSSVFLTIIHKWKSTEKKRWPRERRLPVAYVPTLACVVLMLVSMLIGNGVR